MGTPVFVLDKTFIDYGNVTINDSKIESVIITNTSIDDDDLIISSVYADNNKFKETVSTFVLERNQALNIPISFFPVDTILQTGKLFIVTNGGTGEVDLQGMGIIAPNIRLSTESLYFGKVGIGSTVIKKFRISNVGIVNLIVTQIQSDNSKFVPNENLLVITPGSGKDVEVEYSPTTPGQELCVITISSNDPDSPLVYVNLSGEGISPNISVAGELDFGKVSVGELKEKSLTITNNSDVPLEISNIIISDSRFSISEMFPFTISVQSTISIQVSFVPDLIGAISGVMTIFSNDYYHSEKQVTLLGEGASADISINPSFLDFGNVGLGTTSQKQVAIYNLGTVDLEITQINISNLQFSTDYSSLTIQPSETKILTVTFSPIDLFLQTGIITLVNNDPGQSNITINVSGTGAKPVIVVDTSNIDFQSVSVNTTKNLSLSISNTGLANLVISLSAGPTPFFSVTPISLTVEPGATKQVQVGFSPNTYTSYSGTLGMTTNDPDTPTVSINLLGNGVQIPKANVSVSSINFGRITVGSTKSKVFVLSNTGSASLSFSISINTNPIFTSTPSSGTVSSGGSKTITVIYSPSSSGSSSATLTITTNDPNSPIITIGLTGSAEAGKLSWQAFELDDIIPDAVKEIADKISGLVDTISQVLDVMSSVLNIIKVFIISKEDPLKAILNGIKILIDNLVNDLKQTGLFFLQIFPGDARIDPEFTYQYFRTITIDLTNPNLPSSIVQKYQTVINAGITTVVPDEDDMRLIFGTTADPMSSIKGGSTAFISKILYSFDDPGDGARPQFSSTAAAGAIIIAADSGDIGNILESVRRIATIFKLEFKAQFNPPTNLTAIAGDSQLRLTYSPNDGILSNSYLIFRSEVAGGEPKYNSETIDSQEVKTYWKDEKGRIVTRYKLINVVVMRDQIAEIFHVDKDEAENMLKNAGNYIRGLLANVSQFFSSKFITEDSDVENGKTYFYVISAAMISDIENPEDVLDKVQYSDQLIKVDKGSGIEPPEVLPADSGIQVFSPFSSEVSGMPNSAIAIVEGSLARCRNYRCDFTKTADPEISKVTADEETKKISRNLRFVPIRSSLTIQLKRPTNNVGEFTIIDIPISDYILDSKKITFTRTNFFYKDDQIVIEYNYLKEKAEKEVTEKRLVESDSGVSIFNLYHAPIVVESISKSTIQTSETLLDFEILDDVNGKIKLITTISSDPLSVTIKYRYYEDFEDSQNFRCINPEFSKYYFDFTKCNGGTTLCPAYENRNCYFNNGSECTNAGTSTRKIIVLENGNRVTVPENIPYADFWDSFYCQNGIMAQRCDGYSMTDPRAGYKGVPPDWINYTVIDLFPILKDVLAIMENILQALLGGTENISDSILSFIDLIQEKIANLQLVIDKIQNVLNIISDDFSGPGFYILKVPLAEGGNEYLKKSIQEAQNGPSSDAFGYTAGVVMVYGGPSATALQKALDILF